MRSGTPTGQGRARLRLMTERGTPARCSLVDGIGIGTARERDRRARRLPIWPGLSDHHLGRDLPHELKQAGVARQPILLGACLALANLVRRASPLPGRSTIFATTRVRRHLAL